MGVQNAGSRTMVQIFGIIGFFMAILAIFIASEMMRRTNQRMHELETAFYKLNLRIQQVENRVLEVEKGVNLTAEDRKRQKETLLALEKKTRTPKTGIAGHKENEANARYTPSQYKKKTLGIG